MPVTPAARSTEANGGSSGITDDGLGTRADGDAGAAIEGDSSDDRRAFLRCAAVTSAATLLSGTLLSACAAAITYRGVITDGIVRIPGAQIGLITPGTGLLVDAPGLPEKIWLVRSEEEFLAIGAECTHLKCQVRPRGGFLRCNCHGSTFQLDGRVVRGPAAQPLRRYIVREIDRSTVAVAGAEADASSADVEILIP
ncbi:MAG: Rieske (2Fe-2S) protein [Gemmatimonadetes bacterium]|nr:Rieske (2Fe-2S) protein [Gemmatimonadota bacterium]MBT6145790.1 Rieske (2Fe-2S) protein [Gemmatimonadota bacterium]MBT7861013.1 Rieske (2Fe-2S) protein [Gemmatimonadota bacterium]